jgi:chaperonin GroES
VGDRVMFGRYAGNAVKMNGQDCLRMKEEEIDGVIR